jgi:hypothetical protein
LDAALVGLRSIVHLTEHFRLESHQHAALLQFQWDERIQGIVLEVEKLQVVHSEHYVREGLELIVVQVQFFQVVQG